MSWSSGHRVKSLPWAPSRVERLRALWAKGMTASEIAADLGGISRNGVIGKAHRLGLPARPSPIQRRR